MFDTIEFRYEYMILRYENEIFSSDKIISNMATRRLAVSLNSPFSVFSIVKIRFAYMHIITTASTVYRFTYFRLLVRSYSVVDNRFNRHFYLYFPSGRYRTKL